MDITGKEFGYLRYMERWSTYRAADGALPLAEVIRADERRHFPSIMTENEAYVQSFAMKDIPEADALLVLGYPRALEYAAEIAVRYREKFGHYPELFSVGDGRGMFAQRRDMGRWFQEQLVALGFPKEWAFQNCLPHAEKNWKTTAEVNMLILRRTSFKRRFRVLVVTSPGCSLTVAQELYSAIPHTDFLMFETPQVSERLFDHEVFSSKSYGIDLLIAQYVKARIGGNLMPLPAEKLLSIPRLGFVSALAQKGFAGCITSSEMWKILGISAERGETLHKERLAQLQTTVRPRRFEKQTEQYLEAIRKRFKKKGLNIL